MVLASTIRLDVQHFISVSNEYQSNPAHTGDGVSGLDLARAQLELGAEPTPYQKIVTGTGDVFAPGNHAYQQTTANKPYLRKTPTSGVYWLDSNTATSALTATLGNLGSACTVATAGAEGVTFTEGVTISSTYNIAPAYGFNTDTAIFNRALTAAEKSLVTSYMQRCVPVLANNILSSTWTSSGSWTVTDGIVTAGGTSGADNCANTLLTPTVAGAFYLANLTANTITSFYLDFGSGTGSQIGGLNQTFTKVVMSGGTAPGTIFRVGRWAGSPVGSAGPFALQRIL